MRSHPRPWTVKSKVPGMNYTHLTQAERDQIALLNKAGHDSRQIAQAMSRHPSAGHCAAIALSGATDRSRRMISHRRACASCENGLRVSGATWDFVDERLGALWRPQQICGRLKKDAMASASHESRYQHRYADKRDGGTLHPRCAVKRRAGSVMGLARGAASSPIKCPSISVRPSPIAASASAMGAIWSSAPARAKPLSPSTNGSPVTL